MSPEGAGNTVLPSSGTLPGGNSVRQPFRKAKRNTVPLIESSFDGVIVHQEGKIVYANRTAERLLGSTGNSSILGMDIFGFVHPDFQELVRQRSSTAKSESQRVVHEKFLRLDGTTIDVDVTAAPFVWKGAPAVHVVFRDVTERKKIENESGRATGATALSWRARTMPSSSTSFRRRPPAGSSK